MKKFIVTFLSDGKEYTAEVETESRIFVVHEVMSEFPYALIKSIVLKEEQND